jgi:peptidoglycan/xylan/chitin deacetylase (PgdA/CDA1 family)
MPSAQVVTPSGRGKRKRLVWQSRILVAGVAAVSSFLIALFIPMKAPAQQAVVPWATPLIQQHKTFSVPPKFQGNIIRQVNLRSQKKVIALTFDDGPWPNTTSQVLDILKENKIKATFFLIGRNLKNFPQIAQQVVADGHALGNHTWHHWRRQMIEFAAAREIEDTAALMYKTTGVKTALFRPPNGFLSNGLADYARRRKEVVVLWSVDSGDWRGHGVSVEGLVNHVLEKAKPGAIVLMHDGGGDRSLTVQALPKIIEELTHRGYKFVSVPELLQMQDQEFNKQ